MWLNNAGFKSWLHSTRDITPVGIIDIQTLFKSLRGADLVPYALCLKVNLLVYISTQQAKSFWKLQNFITPTRLTYYVIFSHNYSSTGSNFSASYIDYFLLELCQTSPRISVIWDSKVASLSDFTEEIGVIDAKLDLTAMISDSSSNLWSCWLKSRFNVLVF